MAPTAAIVLPVAELGTAGLLLLPGPWAFVGGMASLVMLLGFTLAIDRKLRAGEHPACHYFGALSDDGVTGATVARNATSGRSFQKSSSWCQRTALA